MQKTLELEITYNMNGEKQTDNKQVGRRKVLINLEKRWFSKKCEGRIKPSFGLILGTNAAAADV